jgi:hypothetical protein
MTPTEIRAAMTAAGIKNLDIVNALGLARHNRSLVSTVVHRLARSEKIERKIAELIGHPPHHVFPEWYAATPEGGSRRLNQYGDRTGSLSRDFGHQREQDALDALFGDNLAHMPPAQLLGATLCLQHNGAAYRIGANPYPPRSPYHADVQIGWELAHRASDAATAQAGEA